MRFCSRISVHTGSILHAQARRARHTRASIPEAQRRCLPPTNISRCPPPCLSPPSRLPIIVSPPRSSSIFAFQHANLLPGALNSLRAIDGEGRAERAHVRMNEGLVERNTHGLTLYHTYGSLASCATLSSRFSSERAYAALWKYASLGPQKNRTGAHLLILAKHVGARIWPPSAASNVPAMVQKQEEADSMQKTTTLARDSPQESPACRRRGATAAPRSLKVGFMPNIIQACSEEALSLCSCALYHVLSSYDRLLFVFYLRR